ncbi:MAG: hypothetical protein LR015_01940 [Verrucomicrobia bacterium]|nr:hypothetical protein [Verrucomicrobiota bacterium]
MQAALCVLLGTAITATAATHSFKVEVDFTKAVQFRMGSLSKEHLERDIYFRSYGNLGAHAPARNAELVTIGAAPGRGTIFQNLVQAGNGPGFTTNSQNLSLTEAYTRFSRTAQFNPGNLPHALALGRFPSWMIVGNPEDPSGLLEDWERQSQNTVLRPDLYTIHAEFLGKLYSDLQSYGPAVSMPAYYSPINEPFWRWDREGLAEYHVAVKEAFVARGVSTAVAGPTAAWPFPLSDFRVWNNTYRRFVAGAGGALDAFDFHFYSKGNWSLPPDPASQAQRVPEPSLFESQKLGVGTVWEYGRLEGYLELVAAAQQAYWPERSPMPVIVSEFGRQGIHPQFGPWENDFKPWLYMTSVIRQWMTYWQRPEIRLTIPFIMSMSNRNDAQSRGQAIFNQPNHPASDEYIATRFYEFYQFFRDLEGGFASVRVTNQMGEMDSAGHIRAAAFRNGNRGYLVVHNAMGFPRHAVQIQVQNLLPEGMIAPTTIEWKRLYYEGDIPLPDSTAPLNGNLHIQLNYQPLPTGTLSLSGESTAIIRFTWPSEIPLTETRIEERFLSSATMIPIEGGDSVITSIQLPDNVTDWQTSRIEIGLARDGGFSIGPCVLINGVNVGSLNVLAGRGVKDWHALIPLAVPAHVWRAGDNVIELQFEGFFRHGFPHVVTTSVVGIH